VEPRVAIVVLNWNGWRDTIECLESIRRITYSNYWTVVVDNGSTDDSLVRIREYCRRELKESSDSSTTKESRSGRSHVVEIDYQMALTASHSDLTNTVTDTGLQLALIRNLGNLGFAEGNNVGIVFSMNTLDARYILLLNNDTVVDPDILTELVTVAEKDKRIGLLGPKTYYHSHEGRKDIIVYAGGKITPWRDMVYEHVGSGERDIGQYEEDKDTDWCTGGGVMIRADLARQRLLNTMYPFGNEDVEYSIKARKDGWRVVYVHRAIMWHKIGVSRAKTGKTIGRGVYWYFRFLRSNFSSGWFIYHVYLFTIAVLPMWLFKYIMFHHSTHVLRDFLSEVRVFVS
jgi:hypothetical protein